MADGLRDALGELAASWQNEVFVARCYGSKTVVNLDAEMASDRLRALLDRFPAEAEVREEFRLNHKTWSEYRNLSRFRTEEEGRRTMESAYDRTLGHWLERRVVSDWEEIR